MNVDETAPVRAASEIDVAAAPETVWDVLSAIDRWPEWNPDVKSVSLAGDLAAGSDFRWKAGPATISSTIQRVERPRLIGWTGRTFGLRAVHVFWLEPRAGNTLVRTEESYDGLLARIAPGRMQRMLQKSLDTGLQHLKAEAERRSAG